MRAREGEKERERVPVTNVCLWRMGSGCAQRDIRSERTGTNGKNKRVKHKRSAVEIQYTSCKSAGHNENDDDDDGLCD